jgi:hypothetical protein
VRALAVVAYRLVAGGGAGEGARGPSVGGAAGDRGSVLRGGDVVSQVRAVTRIATVDDGVDWVELATHTSGAQLERIARGIRRVQRLEEDAADPEQAAYRIRTRTRYDADGNLVITVTATAEDGAVFLAALEAKRVELDRQRQQQALDVAAGTAAEQQPQAPAQADDVPAGTPAPAQCPTPAPQDASLPYTREEFMAAWNSSPYRNPDFLLDGDTIEERDARLARARGEYPQRVRDVPAGTPPGNDEPSRSQRPTVTRCWRWPTRRSTPSATLTPTPPGAPARSSPRRSTRCRPGPDCPTASCSHPAP